MHLIHNKFWFQIRWLSQCRGGESGIPNTEVSVWNDVCFSRCNHSPTIVPITLLYDSLREMNVRCHLHPTRRRFNPSGLRCALYTPRTLSHVQVRIGSATSHPRPRHHIQRTEIGRYAAVGYRRDSARKMFSWYKNLVCPWQPTMDSCPATR